MSLAEYAHTWLRAVEGSLKPGTLDGYRTVLDRHILPLLGHDALPGVTRRQIRAALIEKRRAGRSVPGRMLIVLGSLFRAALIDELIDANPAAGAGYQLGTRAPAAVRALTEPELLAFLQVAPCVHTDLDDAWYLLARAGLRVGEALAARDTDCDFRARLMRVDETYSRARLGTPKSGKVRYVDLSKELTARLRARVRRVGPGWLFPSPLTARPYSQFTVWRVFKDIADAAGLPSRYSPHWLRHTFGAMLRTRGWSLEYIQDQMGHGSVRTTEHYTGGARRLSCHAAVDSLDRIPGRKGPRRAERHR